MCVFYKSIKRRYNPHLVTQNFSSFQIDDKILLSVLKDSGEFTYMQNSGNMGDMLISSATMQFFDKNKLLYKIFDGEVADSVVYGGGGIWVKYYEHYWLKKLPVFETAKRVVILPSSFNNCQKLIDVFDERFIVFCREKKSYDYLISQNTRAKIILDHDMAFRISEDILHGMVEILEYERRIMNNVSRKLRSVPRIAKFMRQDIEKFGNYKTDMDLSSYAHCDLTSSRSYIDFNAKLMLCAVDSVDAVITDRLHVGIAATLMGKEVYLLDNTYGKLSGVYENTMANNPRVHFCKDMPDVAKIDPKKTATDNFERICKAIK